MISRQKQEEEQQQQQLSGPLSIARGQKVDFSCPVILSYYHLIIYFIMKGLGPRTFFVLHGKPQSRIDFLLECINSNYKILDKRCIFQNLFPSRFLG